MNALDSRGDARLGQWEETSSKAHHVRRRLTKGEELVTGPVVDVRGTPEMTRRMLVVHGTYPWAPEQ
jgi:hypothetical protein